jgi:ABC-type antimicrobial peptide transport system permease subunit
VTHRMFGEPAADHLYRPLRASEFSDAITLIVRTTGESRLFINTVQQEIHALDPNLPAASIKTMDQRMEMPLWPVRTAAGLFLICGVLALVLATVGLFGMMYFAVSQRTREFGIRTAVGATQARVMRQVIGEGLWLSVPGIALGIGGALIAGRLLANVLFRINPSDVSPYAGAALIEGVVALTACILPAYRATKADPIAALRID